MHDFSCAVCGNTTYFNNRNCIKCGARLGFLTDTQALEALVPGEGETWRLAGDGARRFRYCANATRDVCNWLVDADGDATYCRTCRHKRRRPAPKTRRAA